MLLSEQITLVQTMRLSIFYCLFQALHCNTSIFFFLFSCLERLQPNQSTIAKIGNVHLQLQGFFGGKGGILPPWKWLCPLSYPTCRRYLYTCTYSVAWFKNSAPSIFKNLDFPLLDSFPRKIPGICNELITSN